MSDPDKTGAAPSSLGRLGVAIGLLAGLRGHDFAAALSFMSRVFPHDGSATRLAKFTRWVLDQMLRAIPDALTTATFASRVSRTSIWLSSDNPVANVPWSHTPGVELPREAEVVVVGAGFTGAACAYHWSKQTGAGSLVVLEMNEASSGASGRNEGLVVMGRFYTMVKGTVEQHLARVRSDLSPEQRTRLASKFAAAYSKSAYKNADLIEQTVREEGFDCDYARAGWIQGGGDAAALAEDVRLGREAGFDDYTTMSPRDAEELGGIRLSGDAGFSQQTASWHPARWVWCLLSAALTKDNVDLYTHTKVLGVKEMGEYYAVLTDRGTVRARHVINATESYTAMLHPELRGILNPLQTQAAFAEGGPDAIKPEVGLSAGVAFFGRVEDGVLFGSDGTFIPYNQAGRNRPSRFITKFLIGEVHRYFGQSEMRVTREWSCTAGFTDDEFPVVGVIDGKRQYIIGGMCGSGSAVHFNGARHVVQRILGLDGPDDYPAEFFAPSRVMDPDNHPWPSPD